MTPVIAKVRRLWTPPPNKKAPSVVGGRFAGIQIGRHYLTRQVILLLVNRNKPNPGNESCRDGLALGLSLHEETRVVSIHIRRYFTPAEKNVNDFRVPIWVKITAWDFTHSGSRIFDFINRMM
jgi:hypothetical protein